MKATVDALETVLTCPLWPAREGLTDGEVRFYDAMTAAAKPYAMAVAAERFGEALRWLMQLAAPLNAMLDDPAAIGKASRDQLVAVWRHYLAAMQVDWGKIST